MLKAWTKTALFFATTISQHRAIEAPAPAAAAPAPSSNYSLDVNKSKSKADQFDDLFNDNSTDDGDDLPF